MAKRKEVLKDELKNWETQWLPIAPADRKRKIVYVVLNGETSPVSLEGWFRFPAGTRWAKITFEFSDSENQPETGYTHDEAAERALFGGMLNPS